MIALRVLDDLVLHFLDTWSREPHLERVFIPGDDLSGRVEDLKARLPYARDRKAADALWDEIEALEARGSVPARWEARDSGMTVGEYLATATLAEQRTFLSEREIRAWHEGPRIMITVDGALARVGGRSALAELPDDE
jgi:hypothetical protein